MSGATIDRWLAAKRDGRALDRSALPALMHGCVDGSVDDAQLGAFAMAVAARGMQADECAELTRAMCVRHAARLARRRTARPNELGGGRSGTATSIDHAVGLSGIVELGQPVTAGEPLLTIHAADSVRHSRAVATTSNAELRPKTPPDTHVLLCAVH